MTTDYLNFLEQNSPEKESASSDVLASNNFVNLTLRADAECQVTCDGDFLVLLNPNQITKEKAPTGQHILQFISTTHPDIQVEKIVDFPEAGKNYLVLVNEFSGLLKDITTREREEEARREKEQAVREAELAKAEAERKRAEEIERRESEERRLKQEKRNELNSINFIDKYLRKVYCDTYDTSNEDEDGLVFLERTSINGCDSIWCYDITNAAVVDYWSINYAVKREFSSIDIKIAMEQEILPAIRIGNPQSMFVYSILLVGNVHCAIKFIKNQEAFNYLMQSIKLGCVEATAYWGALLLNTSWKNYSWIMKYLNIQGEYLNYAKSFLEKAAIAGHADSYYWLARMYMRDAHKIMSIQDREREALQLCQNAIVKGSFSGIVCFASWLSDAGKDTIYECTDGRPTNCPQDDNRALQLYLSAVDMCETREELSCVLKAAPQRMKYDILKCGCEKGICDALEEGNSSWNSACQSTEPWKARSYELAVKLYRLSADQGNADAQNCIANCYYNGNGVSQCYEEAVKWYKLSVNQGNIWAQSNLANCYYDGLGVRQDYEEALRLYKLSAEQNNSWAQYRLGICYYDGLGCHVDYDEAKKWLVLAFKNGEKRAKEYLDKLPASMGDVDIITMLDDSKLTSEQVQSDVEQSSVDDFDDKFGDYLELLEEGDKSVLIKIANCFYKGDGVPKIPEDASLYFMRAIEESEDVDDWREAVSGLKSLAEQGCTEAQVALGDLYSDGWPSTWRLEENNLLHGDEKLSLGWYKKAANAGSLLAMKRLGEYYYNVDNDIDEAESWYKRAIQASGENEGINELIKLYDNEGWEDEALELCERYGRDIEEIREDWSLI